MAVIRTATCSSIITLWATSLNVWPTLIVAILDLIVYDVKATVVIATILAIYDHASDATGTHDVLPTVAALVLDADINAITTAATNIATICVN